MSVERQLVKLVKAKARDYWGWPLFPLALQLLSQGAYKSTIAAAAGNIAYCLWRVPTSCGVRNRDRTTSCASNAKGLLGACGRPAHQQQRLEAFWHSRDWQVVRERLQGNWLAAAMLAGSVLLFPITGLVALVRLVA